MSSAFIKEDDEGPREELPDRPIGPHRNLVTPEGLAQIERELARSHAEVEKAWAAEDAHALAHTQRDLRYWTARRAGAELVHPIADVAQDDSVIASWWRSRAASAAASGSSARTRPIRPRG